MQRRRHGPTHESAATTELDIERQPPFRLRVRNEPPKDAHGYLTVEASALNSSGAVRAFLSVIPSSPNLLIVDARRSLTGRGERMSPTLAAVFQRHGLSRSLRVERAGITEFAQRCERRVTVAAIDGPVDISDAFALERSIVGGSAPLDAELRATAIMQCGSRRTVWAQFREACDARRFVGAALSAALARMIGADATIPMPQDAILLGLVRAAASGCTIRPTDLRDEDGTTIVPVRSSRTGRIATEIALDRITARWYS